MIYKCVLCSAKNTGACEPIVYAKGYSVSLDEYSITAGYSINYASKALYEKANGTTLSLGIVVMNPGSMTGASFFENGKVVSLGGAVQMTIDGASYQSINVLIRNIQSTQLDNDVIISAYISEISSESTESVKLTQFVQNGQENAFKAYEKADATLYSVSYNSANTEK